MSAVCLWQTNGLACIAQRVTRQDVRALILKFMESQVTGEKFHFPLIETERLTLRMLTADDLDAVYVLFNDNDVQKHLSPANRRTREQLKVTLGKLTLYWKERGFGIWCICLKDSKKVIGYCGFQYLDKTPQVEILFGFLKDYWGNGFATEAANACLRFGFEEAHCSKIFATTLPENIASQSVLEKIGMLFIKRAKYYQMDSIIFMVSCDQYTPNKDFYKLSYENNHLIETKPKSVSVNRNSLFHFSLI